MPEMIDVGEVRKRAVRLLRFKDGLWDILLGSVFLLMSVYPLTRELLGPTWNALAFGLVLIVLLLGAAWARVALVIPRRGVAKPRPSTTRTITLVFRVTLVLALLTVVLWTLFATSVLPRPPWGKAPGWVHTLAPDILVATLFVLIFSVWWHGAPASAGSTCTDGFSASGPLRRRPSSATRASRSTSRSPSRRGSS
ncbi:MAG: hypothetical protein NT125_00230 [Candidatus Bipolaricaulota bacterium]|nr:hypothetical protein [Candidatus Bipolaricaulota bacterium]